MQKANRIVVCMEDYKNKEEFENAIKEAVKVLLDNNYIMTIRWDDKGLGIVVIDFNHDDQSYGDYYPYWLLPEEIEIVDEIAKEKAE